MKSAVVYHEMKESKFYCGDISFYSENWFRTHRFICGKTTQELFIKLLGLSEKNRITLETITWRGYLEIKLLHKRMWESFIIAVKRYSKREEWLYEKYGHIVLGNNFVVLFKKAGVKPAFTRCIFNLAANLNKIVPSTIFATIYNDTNIFLEQKPTFAYKSEKDISPSYNSFYAWGSRQMDYTFMLNFSVMLDADHWIELEVPRQIFLRCGDIECNNQESPLNFSIYEKIYLFRQNQVHASNEGQINKGDAFFEDLVLRSATIDLKDEDIILGNSSKIYSMLRCIIQKDNIPVNVLYPCVNKIIGSDMISTIEELNKKYGAHIVYTECTSPQYPIEGFVNLMKSANIKGTHKKTKGRVINLVGFECRSDLNELIRLLDDFFDIRVNMIFLPGVDLKTLKHLYKARVNVINHIEIYNNVFKDVFGKSGIDILMPPPPYGIKQSIMWLAAIADFFKISIEKRRKWRQYYKEKMKLWRRLTRQARRFRVGFIISHNEIDMLINPKKYPFGVPMLKLLEEMGFGVNILITSQASFEQQKDKILTVFKYRNRHKVELLNNPDVYQEWISSTDCNCIYSDFHNDMRIIANGKVQFSLSIFEKGLDGAIRTLQELLFLCSVNFFDRYSQFRQKARPIAIT